MSFVLVAYCPNKNENAGRPGAVGRKEVQLQVVRLANQADPKDGDPNAAHFVDSSGSGHMNLNGLTDKAFSEFGGGKKYEITIREIE